MTSGVATLSHEASSRTLGQAVPKPRTETHPQVPVTDEPELTLVQPEAERRHGLSLPLRRAIGQALLFALWHVLSVIGVLAALYFLYQYGMY